MSATTTKPSSDIKALELAFKECLESNEKLNDIRASLRSDVYHCLQLALNHKFENNDDKEEDKENSNNTHLQPPPFAIEICHGLIREFLQCSGLVHTLSTFEAEVANVFPGDQKRVTDDDDEIMKTFEQQLHQKRDNNNICKENLKIFQNGKRICDLEKKGIPLLLQLVDDIQSK